MLPHTYALSHVSGANEAAKALIALHREFEVPATWAVVGAILENAPSVEIMQATARPASEKSAFNAYIAKTGNDRNLFKADEEVLEALATDTLFDIGSHTYSHLYAHSTDEAVLEADFSAFARVFQDRFGHNPVSIIFPKNQITEHALISAKSAGFRIARVNPNIWLYDQVDRKRVSAQIIRILRFADAYFPVQELIGARRTQHRAPISMHTGSYFFRPLSKHPTLDRLHINRLVNSLEIAVGNGRDFHLWCHPHNFGNDSVRALANAQFVLEKIAKMALEGSITLHTMSDLARETSVAATFR